MKISINKSAKRVLSIALALAMLISTLFTANIGVNINADAATAVSSLYSQWDGTIDASLEGSGTAESPYLIKSAAELAAVCYGSATGSTTGAYFKVDGVREFYMDSVSAPATVKALSSASEVSAHYSGLENAPVKWEADAQVTLNFDGNGATIYGLYMVEKGNAGLFKSVQVGSTIQNIAIKNSYIYCSTAWGTTSDYIGWLYGIGGWNSGTVTIKNCAIINNYCYVNKGNTGEMIGHAGGSNVTITVDSCVVADNAMYYSDSVSALPYQYFIREFDGTYNIKNSIGVDVVPEIRNKYDETNYSNNYYVGTVHQSNSLVGLTQLTSSSEVKGYKASQYMPGLNWATAEVSGFGYWHALNGDYPLPFTPGGWEYVEAADVWNGTAANVFASGSGTEDDPFIIENAEQLYKMVQDGGRMPNEDGVVVIEPSAEGAGDGWVSYTPAYYKVADNVTDLYLNDVQSGGLDALKTQVSASTARDWSTEFDVTEYQSLDRDGDGYLDEADAFIGVFDGNGVTIHGLYSNIDNVDNSIWSSTQGVGFVPAMTGNAVIKNVNFDASYIKNKWNAAVVTTSFGFGDSTAYFYGNCFVSLYNVSVRNAYISSTWDPVSADQDVLFGSAAGLVSSHTHPNNAVFVNCMFDGYSSELLETNSKYDFEGGIFSCSQSGGQYQLIGCVSLGYAPHPNDSSIGFKHMTNTERMTFTDTYTDVALNIATAVNVASKKAVYTESDMPGLDWTKWSLVEVEDGLDAFENITSRTIPMPTDVTTCNVAGIASYKELVLSQINNNGNYDFVGPVAKGQYGHYHKLTGSGTADDPYLVSSALDLANAVATGGVFVSQKLHYKLTNDIDLGGIPWIDADDGAAPENYGSSENGYWSDINKNGVADDGDEWFCKYSYVPFAGTLDGNGYTIYGLNAKEAGALIPELAGGAVKNLHLRDSVASTALIASSVTADSTIDGCSAEDCYIYDGNKLTSTPDGDVTVKITNSYCNDTYYLADGKVGTPVLDGTVWYGIEGGKARLVNRAKAMPYADVNGDDNGYEYDITDVAALRKVLLNSSSYKYAYGDVSKNGKLNTSDLVILKRAVVGDYDHIKDGFWRNLELGNFAIYYGENDNYDAARKLELYLESLVPDVDVKKVVVADSLSYGTTSNSDGVYVHNNDMAYANNILYSPALDSDGNYNNYKTYASTSAEYLTNASDGRLQIIVGDIDNSASVTEYKNTLSANNYAITYDKENAVLWLQGENFTAVEQAVLDFINNYVPGDNSPYTEKGKELSEEKKPRDLDGDNIYDYYYAWGDEFNGVEGTLNEDNWQYVNNLTESSYLSSGKLDQGKYINQEMALNEDLSRLFVIENIDGDTVLSMKRGVYTKTGATNGVDYEWESTDSNGNTRNIGYVGIDKDLGTYYNNVEDTITINGGYSNYSDYLANSNADFGDDIYIGSGKIVGENSLLVKQGYFEFRASFPSDGHSFPCWWMLGEPAGGNNNAYTESLYGKVYRYNNTGVNKYDKTSNSIDSTDISTYKYQLPNASFEIDILEVMQDITNFESKTYYNSNSWSDTVNFRTDTLTGIYDYTVPFNLHKYYSSGTCNDQKQIISWNTTSGGSHDGDPLGIKDIDSSENDWYKSVTNTVTHTFGSNTTKTIISRPGTLTSPTKTTITSYEQDSESQKNLTAMRRYGFEWKVTDDKFVYTIYVFDVDGDGIEEGGDDTAIYIMDSQNGMSDDGGNTYVTDNLKNGSFQYAENNAADVVDPVSDLVVANQYMYFLIDNKFWSANQYYNNNGSLTTNPKLFTDLLEQNGTDKACLDIDYIRVYQAEGRRDIVTPETEAFNNGNHFGY